MHCSSRYAGLSLSSVVQLFSPKLIEFRSMKRISNLPAKAPTIYAFRDSEISVPYRFEEGFDVSSIVVKPYRTNETVVLSADLQPIITVAGRILSVKLSAAQLQKLFPAYSLIFFRNNRALMKADVMISLDPDVAPEYSVYDVVMQDGQVVDVQIIDRQLIEDSLERAEEILTEVTEQRDQVLQWAGNIVAAVSQDEQSATLGFGSAIELIEDEPIGSLTITFL